MQLKKRERPSPEFWTTFERELHIKQRKLLQQQPVDESTFENEFWRRFKRVTALCTATVSCGALGFIVVNNLSTTAEKPQTALDSPTEVAASEVDNPAIPIATEAPRFEVAVGEPVIAAVEPSTELIETKLPGEELMASLPAPTAIPVSHSPKAASIAAGIDEPVPLLDLEKFRTDIEDFDPESALASLSLSADIGSGIEDRYTHPLSDLGYAFENESTSRRNVLDRISSYDRKADFFNRSSSSEVKLDTVSLRF